MRIKQLILFVAFSILTVCANAQASKQKQWYLFNAATDTFKGISLSQAYTFLQNKKPTPLIVAVIDSGVDTAHADLKDILWHNPKEIPGNGIDDDGNGYVDDVYGWNFLGNKDGRNVNKASMEMSRVYHEYKTKYDGQNVDTAKLSADEKYIYTTWKKAAGEIEVSTQDQMEAIFLEISYKAAKKNEAIIKEEYKIDTFSIEDLEELTGGTPAGKKAKLAYINNLKMVTTDAEAKNTSLLPDILEYIDSKKSMAEAKYKVPENYRVNVIGDDYKNFNDRFYGNGDVMAGSPVHGTHVTGIIAAKRNNGVGIDGVAENVKVMTIRAVPDGDEYDKDIALAIRYAVDNGAKVINMSFGKYYSPEKKWVDDAIMYAASKDVLLVHAAGNEAKNSDVEPSYPNPTMLYTNATAPNFITVGAYGDSSFNSAVVANFSNYGASKVNVFAPGMKIYSTTPGNNYANLQGTSMASPVVAGMAAILRSYFPQLSAVQIKEALENSVTNKTMMVQTPGTKVLVPISELCTSGGTVNAYTACVYAAAMKPGAAVKQQEKKEEKKPKKAKKKEKLPEATFEQPASM